MTETIGRKALTDSEKKTRDDEGYKTYQKNISERKKAGEDTLKILNKSEWIKSRPSGEHPTVKFTRLAKKRMTKTLKAMDTIINLSSGQYKTTPEQVNKMVETLKNKVSVIENSFGKVKLESDKGFDF
jgi:hypothetical protein